jgi:phosphomethylpyrimidine synthase
MRRVAEREGCDAGSIREGLAKGTICIPANPNHTSLDPSGIGLGLKTKVNANIGTSGHYPDIAREIEKLRVAVDAGADAVMDLSTGSSQGINAARRAIIASSPLPVGTVPVYQVGVIAQERTGAIAEFSVDDVFSVIEAQAQDGVDFMTVHCGATLSTLERLKNEGRVVDVVSRGGAFMIAWMLRHGQDNPLYTQYDRLLQIAERYDITLSLGDAFRPGSVADATDRAQVHELILLGELVQRAWDAGVQVMVEGPGHVPLHQVEANVVLQKRLCHGAPFYVLGPLVTDVAPGYDHIVAAIGGAIAASAGADFLCYVTPTEHLGLPEATDVREGIMASRIAGHAADIAKGLIGAGDWDLHMSQARKALDWDRQIGLAIDPERARYVRANRNPEGIQECTMCGNYCAMKLVGEHLKSGYTRC